MYYKFSKLMKTIIIFNIVLTLIIGITHGYNIHRINETNEIIVNAMEEQNVSRETAIRRLLKDGEKLFLGQELATFFGVFISITTLFLLYKYSKNSGFFWGFFAALCAVFTSFIGGFLLFYVILSGRSETGGNNETYSLRNEWEKSIHKKSSLIDAGQDKV